MRRGEERRGPNLLSLLPHHANLVVSRDPLPPVLTAGTASSSRTFGSRSEQPRVEGSHRHGLQWELWLEIVVFGGGSPSSHTPDTAPPDDSRNPSPRPCSRRWSSRCSTAPSCRALRGRRRSTRPPRAARRPSSPTSPSPCFGSCRARPSQRPRTPTGRRAMRRPTDASSRPGGWRGSTCRRESASRTTPPPLPASPPPPGGADVGGLGRGR